MGGCSSDCVLQNIGGGRDIEENSEVPASYIEYREQFENSKMIESEGLPIAGSTEGNIPQYGIKYLEAFPLRYSELFMKMDSALGIFMPDPINFKVQPTSLDSPVQINNENYYYFGSWLHGKFHGYGKAIFLDGSVYEGYF